MTRPTTDERARHVIVGCMGQLVHDNTLKILIDWEEAKDAIGISNLLHWTWTENLDPLFAAVILTNTTGVYFFQNFDLERGRKGRDVAL